MNTGFLSVRTLIGGTVLMAVLAMGWSLQSENIRNNSLTGAAGDKCGGFGGSCGVGFECKPRSANSSPHCGPFGVIDCICKECSRGWDPDSNRCWQGCRDDSDCGIGFTCTHTPSGNRVLHQCQCHGRNAGCCEEYDANGNGILEEDELAHSKRLPGESCGYKPCFWCDADKQWGPVVDGKRVIDEQEKDHNSTCDRGPEYRCASCHACKSPFFQHLCPDECKGCDPSQSSCVNIGTEDNPEYSIVDPILCVDYKCYLEGYSGDGGSDGDDDSGEAGDGDSDGDDDGDGGGSSPPNRSSSSSGACTSDSDCAPPDSCVTGSCNNGSCAFTPKNCGESDECTSRYCDPSTPNGCVEDALECDGCKITSDCDDNNGCTIDACIDGQCSYKPNTCNDEDVCTHDICIEGECQNTDNGKCCNSSDECQNVSPKCNECVSCIARQGCGCVETPIKGAGRWCRLLLPPDSYYTDLDCWSEFEINGEKVCEIDNIVPPPLPPPPPSSQPQSSASSGQSQSKKSNSNSMSSSTSQSESEDYSFSYSFSLSSPNSSSFPESSSSSTFSSSSNSSSLSFSSISSPCSELIHSSSSSSSRDACYCECEKEYEPCHSSSSLKNSSSSISNSCPACNCGDDGEDGEDVEDEGNDDADDVDDTEDETDSDDADGNTTGSGGGTGGQETSSSSSYAECNFCPACTACQRCGIGLANLCDETECSGLGLCVFEPSIIGGSCNSDPDICSVCE